MIKGTNHRVIEVMESESEYFNRVLFFVKPEYSALSEGTLRDRADAVARGASAPPPTKIRQAKLLTAAALLLSAALGAALTAAVLLI
jgi:hypothetical protein